MLWVPWLIQKHNRKLWYHWSFSQYHCEHCLGQKTAVPVKIDRKSVECLKLPFFPDPFRGITTAHSTLENRNGIEATMQMKTHATDCRSIFYGPAAFSRVSAHLALIRNQIERKFSTAEQSYAGPGLSHGQILDYSKFCYILVDKNCSHLDAAFMRSHGPGSFFFWHPQPPQPFSLSQLWPAKMPRSENYLCAKSFHSILIMEQNFGVIRVPAVCNQ